MYKEMSDHNMRRFISSVHRSSVRNIVLIPALLLLVCAPVRACTIFVLTDKDRALFCNNEDWSNPRTRIWFIPAAGTNHGGVYVGFDDGWAQGGMNTEGLAYDWVSGYEEIWKPDSGVPIVGNSSQRMLETCSTVRDAIAYYRSHKEMGFFRAKILIADRTGASVRIGATNGVLQVEQASDCRGFGYGQKTLDKMLTKTTEPTVANGFRILRASVQKGATKYANIFDLRSGAIFLHPLPNRDDEVELKLTAELESGGHYYDMPQIPEQLSQKQRPLLTNMKRWLLDECKSIPDKEPKVTAHTLGLFHDALNGTLHPADFTEESWKQEAPIQKEVQSLLRSFGELDSLTLVDRRDEDGRRHYRYRVQFTRATLLFHFIFDEQGRHAFGNAEDVLWKGPS
jgi:hypothetical protein